MKRLPIIFLALTLFAGLLGGPLAHAQSSVVFSITGDEGGSPFWGDVNDCALNACGWGDTWTPTAAYDGAQICGVSTRIVNGTGMTGQLTMNVYTPFSFFADAGNPLIPTAHAQSLLLLGTATVDISTLPVGLGATDPGVQPTAFMFDSCFTISGGTNTQYIFQLTSNSTDPRGLLIALSGSVEDPFKNGFFYRQSKKTGDRHGARLGQIIPRLHEILPTPKAQDSRAGLTDRGKSNFGEVVQGTTGLRLQPLFVEWMMGFPPNWTDASSPQSNTG
jgi:hypothetical protein